jgi:competence protein ComEC
MHLRRRVRGWLAIALLGLALPARAEPLLRVDFIAVGQGDAALITSPTGKTTLIDGGPRTASDALVAFLRGRGVGPLDLVLLTHRHEDHLGGLPAVIDRRGARLFLDALALGPAHASPRYRELLDSLERAQVPVRQAQAGRRIDLGGEAQLVLLTPPSPPITHSRSVVNANSVVARLDYRRVHILFAADAEAPTERWLLESGADLRATVLKVAHHGSRYATSPAFLRAVSPTVAVIEVGAGNEYHHPAPETIARLERAGIRVWRTDRDGNITIETDGDQLRVRSAGGQERLLSPLTTTAALPLPSR